MDIVLGVEGDGEHSNAVLADTAGTLLGVGANDDSSDWDQNGIAAAASALRSCVTEALNAAELTTNDVEGSVFALAGVDFPVDERRLAGIPEAIGLGGRCRIVNDSFAALRAGTDQPYGVVIIAGTGSVIAGRNRKGVEYRSLGLGPDFGDYGSESDISEDALRAVADAFTGRGPQTELTRLLCEATGCLTVVDLLDGTARDRIDSTRFAPLVMEAAAAGDPVSRSLLAHAGSMLGATAVHIIRTLGMEDTAFDLVLARALFNGGSSDLIDALEACIRPVAPDAHFHRLEIAPVVGSALLALELAGHRVAPGARETLADALAETLATR